MGDDWKAGQRLMINGQGKRLDNRESEGAPETNQGSGDQANRRQIYRVNVTAGREVSVAEGSLACYGGTGQGSEGVGERMARGDERSGIDIHAERRISGHFKGVGSMARAIFNSEGKTFHSCHNDRNQERHMDSRYRRILHRSSDRHVLDVP